MSAKISKLPAQQDKSAPKAEQSKGRFRRLRILAAGAVIVAAGLLAYCNSFAGPFVFDDIRSIRNNPSIRRLWPIWDIFSTAPGMTVAGRPVLSLSLAMNYQISGLEVWSYHLVNLGIHILAGLVLFGIVRRTLLSKGLQERFGAASTSLALICALIWLLHPLQTGSVTYIVQRAESLMGLFYLLSLYCAIRGFSSAKSRRWYTPAILACALGVGTKEVAATAPLMILLYDRIFVSRSFREVFSQRRGLYVGLAGTWVLFGALAWLAPRGETVGFGAPHLTAWVYGITQCRVIVLYYLKLAFWPNKLIFDYGWPMAERLGEVWSYALVLVGLLAGTVVAICKRPRLGFLGVWFFVILGPSSSFIPILSEVAAEHRMYLPLAAVVVAVVVCGYALGERFLGRLAISDRQRAVLGRVLGYALSGSVVIILGLLTVTRNQAYSSEFSIWDDTVSKQKNNWRAYANRGLAHQDKGMYDDAIDDFDRVIELEPKHAKAFNKRGLAYYSKGDHERAISDFDQAIELNPKRADPYNDRAVTYLSKGEYERAISDFNQAIELDRRFVKAYNNRGIAYLNKRVYGLAIRDFNQAIELNQKYAKAYNNRGLAYRLQGEYELAIRDFSEAIRLNPSFDLAYKNREIAYRLQGR